MKIMIRSWIHGVLNDFWTFFFSALTAMFSYFLPIKDIVNLMILFFIVDVIFGYWANRKTKGERFNVSKIWETTMPRALISLVLVMLAFMWNDIFYNSSNFATYKLLGGFISGVLLVSIAQNGYKITDWTLFITIAETIESQFKNITKKDNGKKKTGTSKVGQTNKR
jgi:hypothetical protein